MLHKYAYKSQRGYIPNVNIMLTVVIVCCKYIFNILFTKWYFTVLKTFENRYRGISFYY